MSGLVVCLSAVANGGSRLVRTYSPSGSDEQERETGDFHRRKRSESLRVFHSTAHGFKGNLLAPPAGRVLKPPAGRP
jgi:hypothetical protein